MAPRPRSDSKTMRDKDSTSSATVVALAIFAAIGYVLECIFYGID